MLEIAFLFLHVNNLENATDAPISPVHMADVAVAVFCALLFGVLILSSYVALYLQHYWSSFLIICLAITLPVRLRMLRQAHARKKFFDLRHIS
ncbi:hypothetical protein H5410_008724 [Solanum commersonii]|uniref:Uncharacterized protein n=1 Tax=Solanum commersonii TaxID=4109 RepID=A0A9J6AHE8_SOLCO|nr:hypothetical protein H5410_008724 [Solanum commersonii]